MVQRSIKRVKKNKIDNKVLGCLRTQRTLEIGTNNKILVLKENQSTVKLE